MPTYWMTFPDGSRALRFPSEKEAAQHAREIGYQGELVPLKSHPVCSECPLRGHCDNSRWNSMRGGERPPEQAGLTIVHVCRTCMTPSMTTYRGDGTRRAVPPGCPRLDPIQGAAINCDFCQQKLHELHRSHPQHQELMEQATKLIAAVFQRDSETARDMETAISAARIPGVGGKEVAYRMAASILQDLETIPTFKTRWEMQDPRSKHYVIFEWVEWINLLMGRHDTPEQVFSDFLYILADSVAVSWASLPAEERRAMLTRWKSALRREMVPDTIVEA